MKTKTQTRVSRETLLETGYREYTEKDGSILYQKNVRDEKGQRYSINCKCSFIMLGTLTDYKTKFWTISLLIPTKIGVVEIKIDGVVDVNDNAQNNPIIEKIEAMHEKIIGDHRDYDGEVIDITPTGSTS